LALALERMLWQPSTLQRTLADLRALFDTQPNRLPNDEATRTAAIFTDYDTRSPTAKLNYAQHLALLHETLAGLEALPTLRVLAWRTFLAAKVVDQSQIVNTLGVGTSTAPTNIPTTDA